MKQTIKLRESELKRMIAETVRRVLSEAHGYNTNAVYIVFDGTSYYPVYGCDVEDEINTNEVEVAEGPFNDWNKEVDNRVEELNDEAQGAQYDRRKFYY